VIVSTGRTAQIGSHVRRALGNGLKPEEIGELTQWALFRLAECHLGSHRDEEGVRRA
jgi:alkylhydroperoxidase/carboxymuconolactone decarboxylase family protein YurZ